MSLMAQKFGDQGSQNPIQIQENSMNFQNDKIQLAREIIRKMKEQEKPDFYAISMDDGDNGETNQETQMDTILWSIIIFNFSWTQFLLIKNLKIFLKFLYLIDSWI